MSLPSWRAFTDYKQLRSTQFLVKEKKEHSAGTLIKLCLQSRGLPPSRPHTTGRDRRVIDKAHNNDVPLAAEQLLMILLDSG